MGLRFARRPADDRVRRKKKVAKRQSSPDFPVLWMRSQPLHRDLDDSSLGGVVKTGEDMDAGHGS